MPQKPDISPDQKQAFVAIGELMVDWFGKLRDRDLAFNKALDAKIAAQPRGWHVSERDREKTAELERQRRTPRSMTWIKNYGSGHGSSFPALLAGSERMDTGLALMIYSGLSSADFPEDQEVGNKLLALVRAAKGEPASGPIADWLPEAVASMAIRGRKLGP